MFKNFGGGASTGSVSWIELTRTRLITFRNSSIARSRLCLRLPTFEPRAMTTDSGLDIDLVGQLVHVVRRARKVAAEIFARRVDRVDDPFGELTCLETNRQLRRHIIPESGRYFFVD